jgi:hypothetical protein
MVSIFSMIKEAPNGSKYFFPEHVKVLRAKEFIVVKEFIK